MRDLLFDSGTLGLVTRPARSDEVRRALLWVSDVEAAGDHIYVSEVADYEVRRELVRCRNNAGLRRLDTFVGAWEERLLPVDRAIWLLAAKNWATLRQQGMPTADDRRLDADVLIAAQAALLVEAHPDRSVIVVTDNVRHFSRLVTASVWTDLARYTVRGRA